jgi:hypothetical protein
MAFNYELSRADLYAHWLELYRRTNRELPDTWHYQLMHWNYWMGKANGVTAA